MAMHRIGPFRPGRNIAFAPRLSGVWVPSTLAHPPDGYEAQLGTWGVNIDHSTAVKRTGERSIHFYSTTLNLRLQHDAEHLAPVEAGRRYKAWAVAQANSVAGTVNSGIRWMAADRVTEVSSNTIVSAAVAAVDTWQRFEVIAQAPAGAYYARIRFGCEAGIHAYFDEVDMLPAVPLWEVNRSGAQSVASGSFAAVIFNAETSVVDVDFDTSTGEITIVVPGFYSIKGRGLFTGMNDGDNVSGALYVGGVQRKVGSEYEGYAPGGAGTGSYVVDADALMELAAGDVVTFQVIHNYGANRNIANGAAVTFFQGVRIM